MNDGERRIRVLALGNEVRGDDRVGLAAARLLAARYGDTVDVVESGEAGLALLELLAGCDRAIILDAVIPHDVPPGTVIELDPADFRQVLAPSPHYSGLPEVLALADRLGIDFPTEIRILTMAIPPVNGFSEELSPVILAALPAYVRRAAAILDDWRGGVAVAA